MAIGAVAAHRRGEQPHRLEEGVDWDAFQHLDVLEHLVGQRYRGARGGGGLRQGDNSDAARRDNSEHASCRDCRRPEHLALP